MAFLPPNSRLTRVKSLLIASLPIAIPVGTEPVNETFLTSGDSIKYCPVSPLPVTTLITPAGIPASMASSAKRNKDKLANSLGLSTMVQPVVKAEPIFQTPIMSEKFQGTIPATTPIGCLKVKAVYFSPCIEGIEGCMV
ncbi:Uncharacterised protein [Acinetobacter baumannii]|nr:Uncharacterised protein [Acinetobacter baumannii]SVK01642.1 Uncharacterised protein [Acinetobacter baumannii]